jgi:hypothetical protein
MQPSPLPDNPSETPGAKPIEADTSTWTNVVDSDDQILQRVRERAYQRYQDRGSIDGHDISDWLAAEQEIRQEMATPPNDPGQD